MIVGWLSADDLRNLGTAIAAAAGALVAVYAAYRLPFVSRPLNWLGRTLVGDPLTRFFHAVLDSWWKDSPQSGRLERIEYEVRPNGGKSLRDRVDRIESAVCASTPENRE